MSGVRLESNEPIGNLIRRLGTNPAKLIQWVKQHGATFVRITDSAHDMFKGPRGDIFLVSRKHFHKREAKRAIHACLPVKGYTPPKEERAPEPNLLEVARAAAPSIVVEALERDATPEPSAEAPSAEAAPAPAAEKPSPAPAAATPRPPGQLADPWICPESGCGFITEWAAAKKIHSSMDHEARRCAKCRKWCRSPYEARRHEKGCDGPAAAEPPGVLVAPQPSPAAASDAPPVYAPLPVPVPEVWPTPATAARDATAEVDRHAICELGRLFWGDGKQCYSADAVLREAGRRIADTQEALRLLRSEAATLRKTIHDLLPEPFGDQRGDPEHAPRIALRRVVDERYAATHDAVARLLEVRP